jgi:IPT/TIG domain
MRTPALAVKRGAGIRSSHNDVGSSLILVLILMIAGGLIVGALIDAVTNDLRNTSNFASARALQFDTTSATNLAIQNVRYTPLLASGETLNASPPSSCWGPGVLAGFTGTDGNSFSVWCSTVWTPTSANTRVVTLSTCPSAVTASACASDPALQAVVTFDDYPAGLNSPTAAPCVVYCGSAMTVDSWVRLPVPPAVSTLSGISPTSGPITGGTSITVTGSGFVVGATTVDFVEATGTTPAAVNVVLPATGVTVNSPTSLTALSPSVTTATTYFVTVTTPTGTSAYGTTGSDVFTYTAVVPTTTSLSPTSGFTAGGTSVTINGTGFVTGATVSFVEESGGSAVVPSLSLPATNVTVVSNSLITAVSPPVTVGTTYFIIVATSGGTTGSGPSIFTYKPLVPTAASLSPTSGPPGTGVNITGTGFVSGASVNFVAESGGVAGTTVVTLSGASVSVTSATSITAVSPATTAGTTYFITVSTPTGTSNNYPIFTGS